MIQVIIKDMYGTECQLNDVLVIHNPNERIKFFGVLKFDSEGYEFYLTDLEDKYITFPLINYQKFERLCALDDVPAIQKELGPVEVKKVKEFDKIFNLCNQ